MMIEADIFSYCFVLWKSQIIFPLSLFLSFFLSLSVSMHAMDISSSLSP